MRVRVYSDTDVTVGHITAKYIEIDASSQVTPQSVPPILPVSPLNPLLKTPSKSNVLPHFLLQS